MAEIDPVIFEFHAKVNGYLADISRTTTQVDQKIGQQEKRVKSLERTFAQSSGAISGHLRGLAATLATFFTGRELIGLLDNFTRLQNSLRVAGLEGENLAAVQDRLFTMAQRYGVEVNALADLYGKSASAGQELGATQDELLKLTEATAQALKITGTNTAAASGAILGLSQALAAGTVRAEEFNQINEGGLRPLLQAAAASDRWGGSVAKLRSEILDGKVASAELADAILRNAHILEGQASKATLTLAGGFTALSASMIKYFGEADKANGVSAALGTALQKLADNLNTVIPALAAIAALIGARYVGSVVAATGATVAKTAADVRATMATNAMASAVARANGLMLATGPAAAQAAAGVSSLAVAQGVATRGATAAGGALMGAFGGPVGLAILAAGAAIAYVASQSTAAEAAAESLARGQARAAEGTQKAADAANRLATAHGKARVEAMALVRAEAENVKQKLASARASLILAKAEAARQFQARPSQSQSAGSPVGAIGRGTRAIADTLFPGNAKPPAARRADELRGEIAGYEQALSGIEAQINAATAPKIAAVGGGDGKKKPKGGTTSGPSAADIEREHADRLSRLREEQLRAQIDLTDEVGERAALEKELLGHEFQARLAELKNDETFQKLKKDAQDREIAVLESLYGKSPKIGAAGDMTLYGKEGLLAQRVSRDAERKRAQMAIDALEDERRTLDAQGRAADTNAERYAIERRMLKLQQEIEAKLLDEAIAQGHIVDEKEARANLASRSAAQDNELADSQAGPLKRYARDLGSSSVEERAEELVVNEIENLRRSMSDTIASQLGIKNDLFGGLLEILLDEILFRPLAEALSKGSGGGGGGLGGILGGLLGGFFGRASGGYVSPGQMVRVNEGASPGRVEGFIPSGGGNIIPLGQMNQRVGGGGPQAGGQIQVNVTLSEDLHATIDNRATGVAVQVTRAAAPQIMAGATRQTMREMDRPRL